MHFFFDVLLSFRGFETKDGFIRHLNQMLTLDGNSTSIDDTEQEAGDRIDKLFEHVNDSKTFVVILSENYGNSTWCLREITKMVRLGRRVIHVFVNVDPSNVTKHDATVGDAYRKKMEHEWGKLSGYLFQDKTDGNEAAIVELITKDGVKKPLDVAKHPVSIDSHADKILHMLSRDMGNKVPILAIGGIGGLGKSTLAKGMHGCIMKDFEACSFLPNVREKTMQKDLASLQKQLIHDQDPFMNDVDEGKYEIKRLVVGCWSFMMLIIRTSLMYSLLETHWFNSESIVVVTTRNNRTMEEHFQSDHRLLYEPQTLNKDESMLLFSLHAFMPNKLSQMYDSISVDFVRVAHGLPLALTICGPKLFSKRGKLSKYHMMMSLRD